MNKTSKSAKRAASLLILTATQNGLLIFYGDLTGDFWTTSVATFDGTSWVKHKDKFDIGTPSVHVCDPHAIEVDGKILLSVSVDQNSITLTEASDSFEALFERLTK